MKVFRVSFVPHPLSVFLPPPPPPLSSPSLRLCASCYLAAFSLFRIHTRCKWTQGQFLSTPRVQSGGAGGGDGAAGERLARTLAAFRGRLWQNRDLSEQKRSPATFVKVLIVTDLRDASQIFGGTARDGWWWGGGGHVGLVFLSLFLSVFLFSCCLLLPESGCLLGPRLRAREAFYLGAFSGPGSCRPL